MSISTAQKHDLLIQFNQQREDLYENYLGDKRVKKEEEQKAGTSKAKSGSDYTKLYKHLGPETKNKDVRMQLQEEVDMYTDNQLSTSLHQNHIPGYTMDKHNQISQFKDTFKGKTEEPVDKIYFRQKDQIN